MHRTRALAGALATLCLLSPALAGEPLAVEVAGFRAAVARSVGIADPAAAVAAVATARASLDAALLAAEQEIDRLLQAEAEAVEPDPARTARREGLERARDLGALELADGLLRLGRALPEGSPERGDVLAAAEAAATGLLSSATHGWVCAWASLLAAEALLELGRVEEALAGASGLLAAAAAEPGPREAAQVASRRDLLLGALRCRARALLALARPGEARELAAGIERELGAGWRDSPGGRLLELELARAEALAGSPAGAERLLSLIEAARSDPEQARGIEAAAARALSELVDGLVAARAPVVRLPAAALLQAASGYLQRGRPELALVALKWALAGARGDERAAVVPRAAWDAGALLLRDERWLEAALALELLALEAPQDDRAPAAARAALQAARRGCEAIGASAEAGPLAGWVRELARRAAELDPEAGARELLRRAAELEARGEWAAAAALYGQVPAEAPGATGAPLRGDVQGRPRPVQARAAAQVRLAVCLGRLDLLAGRPREALAQVARLGAEAPVSATRVEVEALFALGEPVRADERFQAAVLSTRGEDPGLTGLALVVAQGLRDAAVARFARDRDPSAARALRERAARAAEVWLARVDAASLGAGATWLAGSLLLEGGRFEAAAEHLARGLERFPDGPAEDLDLAAQRRAWALARAGRPAEALPLLRRLRDAVELRDAAGRLTGRGRRVSRELSGDRWVVTLELADGRSTRWWELDAPRAGGLEVRAVEGGDGADSRRGPRPTWARQEERTLRLHLRRAFLVVDGFARATWAEWERTKDARLLADEATAAANERLLLLRGLSEATWTELAALLPLSPSTLSHARWEAELGILRVKLAREEWAAVRGDLNMLELTRPGARAKAPREVQAALLEIERELARRGQ